MAESNDRIITWLVNYFAHSYCVLSPNGIYGYLKISIPLVFTIALLITCVFSILGHGLSTFYIFFPFHNLYSAFSALLWI